MRHSAHLDDRCRGARAPGRESRRSRDARRLLGIAAVAVAVAAMPMVGAAIEPSGSGLPVGPPARLQGYHAGLQARATAASPAFRALVEMEGGRWAVRWDERSRQPRTLWAPGIRWDAAAVPAEARALLARHEGLLGVAADDLALATDTRVGERRFLSFQQLHRGVEVEGGGVDLVLRADGGSDRLQLIRDRAVAVGPLPTAPDIDADVALTTAIEGLSPERIEVVEVGTLVVFAGEGRPALAWRSRVLLPARPADVVSYVDARDGTLLYAYDDVRHELAGTASLEFEQRTVDDPLVVEAGAWFEISGPPGSTTTDVTGWYELPGQADATLEYRLRGPHVEIHDEGNGGAVPVRSFSAVAGAVNDVTFTQTDASWAAVDVAGHFDVVRGYVEQRYPALSWLNDVVPAAVGITHDACNAYYWNGSMSFYAADPGGQCVDFGRVSDVVYHEYGHGVHDYIIQVGGFDGTVSEGSADYLSATIWDDPVVGDGCYGPGTWIRELASDRVYPDDIIGEVHHDGLIWGSALWDLREEMITLYGYDDGVEATDLLFLGALETGPTLTDTVDSIVLADDDDGDLTNGTPHLCLLLDVMGDHGLGPGSLGYFLYDHQPLDTQPSAATEYPVDATFQVVSPACADFDPNSVTLHFARDPAGPFDPLPMSWDGADGYSAAIPRHPSGSTIYYYLSASDVAGNHLFTTHDEDEYQLYRFYVGDLDVIYCDDMEAGDGWFEHGLGTPASPQGPGGDWERGAPAGLSGDPATAWSGSAVWGTDLGLLDDGEYSNNTMQYLHLPDVDVSGYPGVRLQYRRWLTVEDGFYDHAILWVNGVEVWENPWTQGGGVHWFDLDWQLHDEPIDDLIDPSGLVSVSWTLESDQGLEFGGWTIDDVCVVAPHDVPGQYTVEDFDASDGEEQQSTLTWTHPYVEPLWAVVVVRNTLHAPQDFTDGVIVHLDPNPVWGEAQQVVDENLSPDTTYHYTVFAADDAWSFLSYAVAGASSDSATTAPPLGDDDDTTGDDDDSTGDDDSSGDDDTADDDSTGDDDTADDDDTSSDTLDPIESNCACRTDGQADVVPPLAGLALIALGWRRRRLG